FEERFSAMHDLPAIMTAILDSYVLPVRGFHGIVNWARVFENGLRIVETTGSTCCSRRVGCTPMATPWATLPCWPVGTRTGLTWAAWASPDPWRLGTK